MASSSNSVTETISIKYAEHHVQQKLCGTRPKYRQGKELKAVKVYTINDESTHLILQNIPNVGLAKELRRLCGTFGRVEKISPVSPTNFHPVEPFTCVFYVKFATLRQARYAKVKLDNRAFYGEVIHAAYCPELETVEETRDKLNDRRQYIQSYAKKKNQQ